MAEARVTVLERRATESEFVRARLAGAEVDRGRERHRAPGRKEAHVAERARLRHGDVQRDGSGRRRNAASAGEPEEHGGAGGVRRTDARVRHPAGSQREEPGSSTGSGRGSDAPPRRVLSKLGPRRRADRRRIPDVDRRVGRRGERLSGSGDHVEDAVAVEIGHDGAGAGAVGVVADPRIVRARRARIGELDSTIGSPMFGVTAK